MGDLVVETLEKRKDDCIAAAKELLDQRRALESEFQSMTQSLVGLESLLHFVHEQRAVPYLDRLKIAAAYQRETLAKIEAAAAAKVSSTV